MANTFRITPKVYRVSTSGMESIVFDNGTVHSCQIVNVGDNDVYILFNGDSDATMLLEHGSSQSFQPGELTIESLDIFGDTSGGVSIDVQVIVGLVGWVEPEEE